MQNTPYLPQSYIYSVNLQPNRRVQLLRAETRQSSYLIGEAVSAEGQRASGI